MLPKFKFEQNIPDLSPNINRKVEFAGYWLDPISSLMDIRFNIWYKSSTDTEWDPFLVNSQTSVMKNPNTGNFNFISGQPLSLLVTRSTLVNIQTGQIVDTDPRDGTVTTEFEFYESLLSDFENKTVPLLKSIYPNENQYGLPLFIMFALDKAISQNRFD